MESGMAVDEQPKCRQAGHICTIFISLLNNPLQHTLFTKVGLSF